MAPYRGVSRPVITFAIERLMDKAAAAFGLGPVEIRRRNLIGQFPYTSATGLVFDEGSYLETLEQAIAHVDLKSFRAQQTRSAQRAAAIAASALRPFPNAPATAARPSPRAAWRSRRAGKLSRSTMDPSGRVEARIGASPHGQGLRTTLAADHRRRSRRRAAAGAHRARRHRPHALRLGHVRQPLAGHRRRRVTVGGAKDPQKTAHHRQPCAWRPQPTTSCSKTATPKCPEPIAP